jgi:hypothetical protein
MSRVAEWTLIFFAFLFLSASYASTQPVTTANDGFGPAGRVYHAMAKAMPRQLPPTGEAPEVYRIGLPLAVAGIAKSLDWVISAGFDRLNLVFSAFSIAGLTLLLQRHVPNALPRLVVISAFMLEPHSSFRLSYFMPISVNASAMAFLIAGLLAIDWYRASPGLARAVVLAALVAVGVTVHEVVLVIGVCAACARAGRRDWLPLAAGLFALVVLHSWIVATPSTLTFTYDGQMWRWLVEKSPARYLQSWLFVFGPFIVIPILYWRSAVAFLSAESALFGYLVALAAYAWVGGPETEELLAFASPVVWILIARAIALSGVADASGIAVLLLGLQVVALRGFVAIGGPLDTPVVNGDTWERLGWAGAKTYLSYENMRAHFGDPFILNVYALIYILACFAVVAFLYQRGDSEEMHALLTAHGTRLRAQVPIAHLRARKPLTRGLVFGVALPLVLAPVIWLSVSRFYWSHFDTPAVLYLFYNLARVWTGIVLFLVFWASGARILNCAPARGTSAQAWVIHVECAVAGAAAWSLAIVLLASFHLYRLWLVLPVVAIGLGVALHDLTRNNAGQDNSEESYSPSSPLALLARIAATASAIALLVAIVLWGNTVGDYDVFGTYLAYYQAVLDNHSNGPNPYYVHYWITRGHGLGFLFNILSDVQGAGLATYGVILVGGAMVWRLAVRSRMAASAIGWAGVIVYLSFYMHGGAVAKPHTIRNTLILYLALSFVSHIAFRDSSSQLYRWSRLLVITAILLMTPMSIAIILPMFVAEVALITLLRGQADAFRMLLYPAWAICVSFSIWLLNYSTVGLPEAPLVMQGHFMNAERFARWLDPALAYLKFGGTPDVAGGAIGSQAGELLVRVFNPTAFFTDFVARLGQMIVESTGAAALVLSAGGVGAWILTRLVRRRSDHASAQQRLLAPVAYLLFVIAILISFRMLGGGSTGSSTARFTDFIDPLLTAIGVLLLSSAWFDSERTSVRHWVGLLIGGTCVVASAIGLQEVARSPWASGLKFLVGAESYASIHEASWRTATAARVASMIPGVSAIELLTDNPAFTGLPSTRFQVPDGCEYCRDFSQLAFGTADQAEAIYRNSGVDYFLFDLADGPAVFWSGFGPMYGADSVMSRFKVFAHVPAGASDFYVLTWRIADEPRTPDLEQFVQKWMAKVERERKTGYYGLYLRTYSR